MAEEKAQGYPAQTGYPTQPGYPTQQPGYPTQQPGYPTQQPDPVQQGSPQTQAAYPYPPSGQPGYPEPPPAYGASLPPQAPQTVVVSTVHSTIIQQLHDSPANVQCPNCHNNVTSTIVYESGTLVILMVLVIAFVMQLYCGCCLIPLCINALKDVHHICPVCSYRLGVYKRL